MEIKKVLNASRAFYTATVWRERCKRVRDEMNILATSVTQNINKPNNSIIFEGIDY
jgi:hypothetical protein